MSAGGLAPLGNAIHRTLDAVENRKQRYRDRGVNYFRPWVFLVTAGRPDDEIDDAARRVRTEAREGKHSFFPVGVEGADSGTLDELAPDGRSPLELEGLEFTDLFTWGVGEPYWPRRSGSGSSGEDGGLPDPDGWEQVQ